MNSKMELKVRKRWEFAVGDTTTEFKTTCWGNKVSGKVVAKLQIPNINPMANFGLYEVQVDVGLDGYISFLVAADPDNGCWQVGNENDRARNASTIEEVDGDMPYDEAVLKKYLDQIKDAQLRRYIKACALDAYNYLEDMYDDDKEEE